MQRAIRMLHDHTHFRVDSQKDTVKTTIGTRAGDCWADVVFGFLFSRILAALDSRLQADHLLSSLPEPDTSGLFHQLWQRHQAQSEAIQMISPTWMDDLCLCLDADTGPALATHTASAASALLDVCAQHLVSPNLQKGKTEVIMVFRGAQSRRLRTSYYGPASGQRVPIVYEYGIAQLNVVAEYQHLGGLLHHTGVTKKELSRRVGIANAAFNQHRRLLFQNSQIPFSKRRQLFETLVLSKFCYGMETWVVHDQRTWRYFEAAVIRLYRRLLRIPGDQHSSDMEILGLCGLPSATMLLRRARLRYLATLYACEQDVPWRLLLNDHWWMALVHEDLQWLGSILCNTCTLGTPADHPGNWDYILRWHRPYWKRLLRRAFTLGCAKTTDEAYLVALHRRVFDLLRSGGALAHSLERPQAAPSGTFACLRCQTSFKSKAGEKAHMFKCHGQINPLRFLFDGTQCSACLKECYAHSKLLSHLRNTASCRTRLLATRIRCAPAPGSGSQVDQEQLRRHNGTLPPQQGAGPLPEALAHADPVHPHLLFIEATAEACLTAESESGLTTHLQTLGSTHSLAWTDFQAAIEVFLTTFEDDLRDAPLPLAYGPTVQILRQVCQPDHWDFLRDQDPMTQPRPLTLIEYEAWATTLRDNVTPDCPAWSPTTVPRIFYKERVVLHAFSGRRRRGDFQWYLEGFQMDRPDCYWVVVSMDLVIDPLLGDAKNQHTQDFWLHHARSGHICGFLGGPPCCTWSKARGHQLSHSEKKQPRVIRSASELWGFLSVSIREQMQLQDGHELLGFCLLMLVALHVSQGSGILEHPAEPQDVTLASIWRLPIVGLLLALPEMARIDLAQGLLGAISPKPTCLMALRLPRLLKSLHQNRVCRELPKGTSIGVSSDGQFRTAPLKEYPPAMCRALAMAFEAACRVDPVEQLANLPVGFLDQCQQLNSTEFGSHIGQDYAPRA